MKKLSGFSLMEMMIVLLIVSVVAAASAPMINKKMVTAATDKSPWVWVGNQNNIAYNLNGANRTATIGATVVPNNSNARLYIDTKDDNPQIVFGENGSNILKLISAKKNIWLSGKEANFENMQNSIAIGSEASTSSRDAIVIGNANSVSDNAISIGLGIKNVFDNAIAIGRETNADTDYTIAIGNKANVSDVGGTAIGADSKAGYLSVAFGCSANSSDAGNSIAIGNGANSSAATNSIAIGPSAISRLAFNSIALGVSANASSNNSIAIGHSAKTREFTVTGNVAGDKQIAIGVEAEALYIDSVAIGTNATASNYTALAIGQNATAYGTSSISIGREARTGAAANDSAALGCGSNAAHFHSTAIGYKATTTASNQIVLGTANDTVYIPGNLVVGKYAVLGQAGAEYMTVVRAHKKDSGTTSGKLIRIRFDGDNLERSGGEYDSTHVGDLPSIYPENSDRRLKNVGKAFVGGLEQIKKLDVFNYTFKNDKTKTPRVGVMAQDLQKIFPDAVIKGEDGFLRIRMEDMFYALINAVKENDKRITNLEKENQELKKQNQEILKRLTELEKKVK